MNDWSNPLPKRRLQTLRRKELGLWSPQHLQNLQINPHSAPNLYETLVNVTSPLKLPMLRDERHPRFNNPSPDAFARFHMH